MLALSLSLVPSVHVPVCLLTLPHVPTCLLLHAPAYEPTAPFPEMPPRNQ